MLSPGVKVNEIDLSIVVPTVSNATAAFAGEFTKGPSDKFMLITNADDLKRYYGEPTNSNFNDWFQAYNFLQYGNKLLVSRAVDANGTWNDSGNEVYAVNEDGKVEVTNEPQMIQAGSLVKFDENSEDEYKVKELESPVDAVAQVDEITIDSAADGDYSIDLNGTVVTYTADVTTNGDTTDVIATNLGALLEDVDSSATNVSVTGSVITYTASVAGTSMSNSVASGDMTLVTSTANVPGESYELVFEEDAGSPIDFTSIATVGASVLVKDAAYNAIAEAQIDGMDKRTAQDLVSDRIFISNEDEYEVIEDSIPVHPTAKLKFIAKSSGDLMNGIEIAVARESDFDAGNSTAFPGIILNDLFENKPLEADKEVAILVKDGDKIKENYIVSLKPGSKDYRGKSNYIEDVVNHFSDYLYIKNNEGTTDMPESRLFQAAVYDETGSVVTPAENNLVYLSNGSDGSVNMGDIITAYGSVSNNTIFGNCIAA